MGSRVFEIPGSTKAELPVFEVRLDGLPVERVLRRRNLPITEAQAAQLAACKDLDTLERWHDLAERDGPLLWHIEGQGYREPAYLDRVFYYHLGLVLRYRHREFTQFTG